MSTKEKIINLIDGFSDEQLTNVLIMLESLQNIVDEETEDDAYCESLYNDYKSDKDGASDNMSLEQFASELGVNL